MLNIFYILAKKAGGGGGPGEARALKRSQHSYLHTAAFSKSVRSADSVKRAQPAEQTLFRKPAVVNMSSSNTLFQIGESDVWRELLKLPQQEQKSHSCPRLNYTQLTRKPQKKY